MQFVGLLSNGISQNTEINECELPVDWGYPCAPAANCTNSIGGYQCTCPDGYSGGTLMEGCTRKCNSNYYQ